MAQWWAIAASKKLDLLLKKSSTKCWRWDGFRDSDLGRGWLTSLGVKVACQRWKDSCIMSGNSTPPRLKKRTFPALHFRDGWARASMKCLLCWNHAMVTKRGEVTPFCFCFSSGSCVLILIGAGPFWLAAQGPIIEGDSYLELNQGAWTHVCSRDQWMTGDFCLR